MSDKTIIRIAVGGVVLILLIAIIPGLISSPMFENPLGLVLIALYLLPAAVAWMRGHHNQNAIALLNILLGWTVIGWIGALIWAATAVNKPAKQMENGHG